MWTDPAQGRWVCVRCFESNEANADQCQKCGLERGADPNAAAAGTEGTPAEGRPAEGTPAPQWAAPAQPQRAGWLQYVLRFWWVGLLVIGGAVFGVNYLMGSRAVTDIGVGECFDLPDANEQEIDDLTQRECTEAHEFEMFYVADMPDGPYPSDDETVAWIEANCLPAFADYVGMDYQTSELDVFPITSTEATWNDGDHSVQCALYEDGNPELTSSQKDSAR
ncbi:MAG TPA: septum formation family protein [Candidatus Limnocylindria bacterium]